MADIFNNIWNYIDEMDFVAQKKVDKLYKLIILIVAILSFGVAYAKQQFSICVYSVLIAAVVCGLAFGPGWPWWKKNPIQWKPKST